MNQLTFAETHARANDPGTSKQAAVAAITFSGSQKERIFRALDKHGPRSAHELSLILGLTVVQIDRRLPDLIPRVRVQQDAFGEDVVRNNCRVWEVVRDGR